MKITKEELKNLINEEIEKILESEEEIDEGLRDVLAGIRGGAGKVGSDVSAYAGAVKKAGHAAYTTSRLSSELAAIHKTIKNSITQLAGLQTKAKGLGLDYDLSPALASLNSSLNPIATIAQSIKPSPTARVASPTVRDESPESGSSVGPSGTPRVPGTSAEVRKATNAKNQELARAARAEKMRKAAAASIGRPEGEETVRMAEEE